MDPQVNNRAEDMLALARTKHARFNVKQGKQAVVLYVSSSRVWVRHAETDVQLASFSSVEGIMIELHPISGALEIMDHTGISRYAVSCMDSVFRDVLALTIRRMFSTADSTSSAEGGRQAASDDEADLMDFLNDEESDVSDLVVTEERGEAVDLLAETGPLVDVSITLAGIASSEEHTEASASTIAELRAQLSFVERDLSRTTKEFNSLQETYRLERLEIDEASKLRVQLDDACSDRDSGKDALDVVHLTLDTLSQQLTDKAAANVKSADAVRTLTKENGELEERVKGLVQEGKSASLEVETRLQGELDRLREEVGTQAEELVRKKAEIADLADCRESEEKAKELQQVAEEYAHSVEDKLKKAKSKKKKLTAEITNLRNEGALTEKETLEELRTLLAANLKQSIEQDEVIGELRKRAEAFAAELAKGVKRVAAAEDSELAAKKDMLEQVSAQRKEGEMMTTERNFFKRKASSLVASVESLRKELDAAKTKVSVVPRGARNKELDKAEAKVAKLTAELGESISMGKAYKEAFEQQLKHRSKEEKKVKVAKSKGVKPDASGMASLQNLTTSLSEMLVDKELIITNAKQSNELLGQRINDLEAELCKSGCASCRRPTIVADQIVSKQGTSSPAVHSRHIVTSKS
jgi:chromosome segregation ATPase